MAKSLSIPVSLSELTHAPRVRLSAKQPDKQLDAFAIFLAKEGDSVKLYGSSCEGSASSIGDEIIRINEHFVAGKTRDEIMAHLTDCIRSRVISLTMKKNTGYNRTYESEPSTSQPVTDIYIVSVRQQDTKGLEEAIKQKFPTVPLVQMEAMFPSDNVARLETISNECNNNKVQIAKCVGFDDDVSRKINGHSPVGYSCDTNNGTMGVGSSEMKTVPSTDANEIIVSVRRISEQLSRLCGKEEDSRILIDFFQSAPVREAIEATSENTEKKQSDQKG